MVLDLIPVYRYALPRFSLCFTCHQAIVCLSHSLCFCFFCFCVSNCIHVPPAPAKFQFLAAISQTTLDHSSPRTTTSRSRSHRPPSCYLGRLLWLQLRKASHRARSEVMSRCVTCSCNEYPIGLIRSRSTVRRRDPGVRMCLTVLFNVPSIKALIPQQRQRPEPLARQAQVHDPLHTRHARPQCLHGHAHQP